jgi:hypothetical protein
MRLSTALNTNNTVVTSGSCIEMTMVYRYVCTCVCIYSPPLQQIAGNTDTTTAVLHELHPPIVAQRLRFVPTSQHERMVCMRVEVYGCEREGKWMI